MMLHALEESAAKIPHMGGRTFGHFLRDAARNARNGTAIVELGCWLGAGTAQIALGMRENQASDVTLHVYDNFHTSPSSARKANEQGYPDVHEGMDTLALVQSTLAPFDVPITWTKGMLGADTSWIGKPISVFIDDATKYGKTFRTCLNIFGPTFIPGETLLILMDFNLFKKRKEVTPARLAEMKGQFDFIEAHKECFEPIPTNSAYNTAAAFRYLRPVEFPVTMPDEKPST